MFAYCGNNPVNGIDNSGHAMRMTNTMMTDTDVNPQRMIIEQLEATTGDSMYYSQDAAAEAVAEELFERSRANNVEYCAMIYRIDLSLYGGCGYAYYSDAIMRGMHDNVFFQLMHLTHMAKDMIGKQTAFVHSHPHCTCHKNNEFSLGDKGVPALSPVSSVYLIGPNHLLQRWDKDGREHEYLKQQIFIGFDNFLNRFEDFCGGLLP